VWSKDVEEKIVSKMKTLEGVRNGFKNAKSNKLLREMEITQRKYVSGKNAKANHFSPAKGI
jgi:hypothetical protein